MNRYNAALADLRKDSEYIVIDIMRPNSLSNPFKITTEADRNAVIDKFRRHLWEDMKRNGPMNQELKTIINHRLAGKSVVLVCCCKPKKCHGDIIKSACDYLIQQRRKP